MTHFSYRAVNASGKQISGQIEAESATAAAKDLAAQGCYVLTISACNPLLHKLRVLLLQKRVRRSEIIELASNLSVMVGAGIPITMALGDITATITNTTLQSSLSAIKQDIEQGSTFSDAIERYDNLFPDIFIRLVRVGEETGRFEKSLSDVAEHLQRMEDLASSIKRALIYPAFAIISTVGALVFWLVYVLPKIISTLQGMGVKLPLLTRILMAASDYTQRFWYLAPIIVVLFILALKVIKIGRASCRERV